MNFNSYLTLTKSALCKILLSFLLVVSIMAAKAQDIPYLSVTMASSNASDETIIAFADGATSAYDVDWDAVKFYGGGINLVSYAQNDTTGLSVNFFAPLATDSLSVKLGMFPSQNGTYTFSIQNQSSFTGTQILLKDAYLNTVQDITSTNSISFSITSSAATRNNRFYVIFKPTTAPPVNLAPSASNLSISGIAKVGYQLYANYTYSDTENDAQGTSVIAWLRNGSPIAGAGAASYTLSSADLGSTISFEVTPVAATGTASGLKSTSPSTGTVIAQSAPVASSVSISGTTKVGSILQANYTYADADGDLQGASTKQWLRNGTAIAGANGSNYTLTATDYGTTIKFEVTPVSATGSPSAGAKASSAATASITANPHVVYSATSVSKVSNKAQVNWSTSTESYNSYFVVERSTSPTTGFAAVSSNIAGYANSSSTKTYTFSDPNTKKGTYYYRVKAVSQFGTTLYSSVVSIAL